MGTGAPKRRVCVANRREGARVCSQFDKGWLDLMGVLAHKLASISGGEVSLFDCHGNWSSRGEGESLSE